MKYHTAFKKYKLLQEKKVQRRNSIKRDENTHLKREGTGKDYNYKL